MSWTLGTRGSELALAQSNTIAQALRAMGHEVELSVLRTAGDRDQSSPFAQIGRPGVFVGELEQALLRGEVDFAVHSFKDLPSLSSEELEVASVPQRRAPEDVLVTRPELILEEGGIPRLQPGVRIGSSSARRAALVGELFPGAVLTPLRGNVPTRLQRVLDGEVDAALLARAGLARLEEQRSADRPLIPAGLVCWTLDPLRFTPAPAQGALALQCRRGRPELRSALASLEDPHTRQQVDCERALMALAEGNCSLAFGAWCQRVEEGWCLHAALGHEDRLLRVRRQAETLEQLAELTWRALRERQG